MVILCVIILAWLGLLLTKGVIVYCRKAGKASAVAGKLDVVLGLTVPMVGWPGSVRAIVGAEGRQAALRRPNRARTVGGATDSIFIPCHARSNLVTQQGCSRVTALHEVVPCSFS